MTIEGQKKNIQESEGQKSSNPFSANYWLKGTLDEQIKGSEDIIKKEQDQIKLLESLVTPATTEGSLYVHDIPTGILLNKLIKQNDTGDITTTKTSDTGDDITTTKTSDTGDDVWKNILGGVPIDSPAGYLKAIASVNMKLEKEDTDTTLLGNIDKNLSENIISLSLLNGNQKYKHYNYYEQFVRQH